MIRLSTLLSRGAAALMLGSLLVLAGCHRGATKDQAATKQEQSQFDMTVQTYKNGQFMIDGAVLSALDAGSHFAYLKDIGRLPKTVLLQASDDSKIRKQHLQYMARLQLDYGFVVYYDDGGTLKRINPIETKARALEDYRAPNKDASGSSAGASDGSSAGQPPQH